MARLLSFDDIARKEDRFGWSNEQVKRDGIRYQVSYVIASISGKIVIKAVYQLGHTNGSGSIYQQAYRRIEVEPYVRRWIEDAVEQNLLQDQAAEEHIAATGGYGR